MDEIPSIMDDALTVEMISAIGPLECSLAESLHDLHSAMQAIYKDNEEMILRFDTDKQMRDCMADVDKLWQRCADITNWLGLRVLTNMPDAPSVWFEVRVPYLRYTAQNKFIHFVPYDRRYLTEIMRSLRIAHMRALAKILPDTEFGEMGIVFSASDAAVDRATLSRHENDPNKPIKRVSRGKYKVAEFAAMDYVKESVIARQKR